MEQKNNLTLILKKGIEIKSSGTTGPQKKIFQSPRKLKYANEISRDCQKISSKSKIVAIIVAGLFIKVSRSFPEEDFFFIKLTWYL